MMKALRKAMLILAVAGLLVIPCSGLAMAGDGGARPVLVDDDDWVFGGVVAPKPGPVTNGDGGGKIHPVSPGGVAERLAGDGGARRPRPYMEAVEGMKLAGDGGARPVPVDDDEWVFGGFPVPKPTPRPMGDGGGKVVPLSHLMIAGDGGARPPRG